MNNYDNSNNNDNYNNNNNNDKMIIILIVQIIVIYRGEIKLSYRLYVDLIEEFLPFSCLIFSKTYKVLPWSVTIETSVCKEHIIWTFHSFFMGNRNKAIKSGHTEDYH